MKPIIYIERTTGTHCVEKVYGESTLRFLYGNGFGKWLSPILAKNPICSTFYGYIQKSGKSAKKVIPFINKYGIDSTEFLEPPSHFKSFNDFFIRKLKLAVRPIAQGDNIAVMPADGRYYFYPNIDTCDGFIVKGEKFDLKELLNDEKLAQQYCNGSLVIGRLCPVDYHRFHFACNGIPGDTKVINGWLYSVNPIAIKQNIKIFTQNKRTLCELQTDHFGKVLVMEFGATTVGTIIETYTPHQPCLKGDEKGYFSFGGSALMLIFEKDRIAFDSDLLAATAQGLEIRCQMGQSLGKAIAG